MKKSDSYSQLQQIFGEDTLIDMLLLFHHFENLDMISYEIGVDNHSTMVVAKMHAPHVLEPCSCLLKGGSISNFAHPAWTGLIVKLPLPINAHYLHNN